MIMIMVAYLRYIFPEEICEHLQYFCKEKKKKQKRKKIEKIATAFSKDELQRKTEIIRIKTNECLIKFVIISPGWTEFTVIFAPSACF